MKKIFFSLIFLSLVSNLFSQHYTISDKDYLFVYTDSTDTKPVENEIYSVYETFAANTDGDLVYIHFIDEVYFYATEKAGNHLFKYTSYGSNHYMEKGYVLVPSGRFIQLDPQNPISKSSSEPGLPESSSGGNTRHSSGGSNNSLPGGFSFGIGGFGSVITGIELPDFDMGIAYGSKAFFGWSNGLYGGVGILTDNNPYTVPMYMTLEAKLNMWNAYLGASYIGGMGNEKIHYGDSGLEAGVSFELFPKNKISVGARYAVVTIEIIDEYNSFEPLYIYTFNTITFNVEYAIWL